MNVCEEERATFNSSKTWKPHFSNRLLQHPYTDFEISWQLPGPIFQQYVTHLHKGEAKFNR